MKKYLVAAGALLIGTSASAYDAVEADKLAALSATEQLKTAVLAVVAEAAVAETARAVAASAEKEATAGGDPDLDLAVVPDEADEAPATEQTGVGGPLEEAAPVAAIDLTPRPAAQNYPPCRPGPGDDNCIQLYEPGVRAQLASWNRPTGGLGDGQPAVAMGGPYEPVEGGTSETAMNGDGALDVAMGEAAADEVAAM